MEVVHTSIDAEARNRAFGSMSGGSTLWRVQQPPDLILHRGDHLRERGKISGMLFQVTTGFLKSYVIDLEGREHVTQFHFPGDMIGLDSLGFAHQVANTIALDTCGILRLKSEGYLSGKLSTEEATALIRAFSRESHTLHSLASDYSAKERFAAFLVTYSERMAELGLSADEFQLPMNRADIGNYLRLTPCTISRLFTSLCKDEVIDVCGSTVTILDRASLVAECQDLRVL